MRELRLRIREEHKLIQVEQEGAYTFVKIGCGTYFGVGFSKYNPFDMKRGLPYSPEMGVLKATNKAIEDVARQIVITRCAERTVAVNEFMSHGVMLPMPGMKNRTAQILAQDAVGGSLPGMNRLT